MKARIPIRYQHGAMGSRRRAVWRQQLLTCWTLHRHFGFGRSRLLRYLGHNADDATELGRLENGYAENRTWQDELWDWGDRMGLNDVLQGGGGDAE